MAVQDYAEFQEVAKELLTEFGGSMTLTLRVQGTYTDGVQAYTTQTRKALGVVTDFSARERAGLGIAASSKKVILNGKDLAEPPTIQEEIFVNGVTNNILSVRTVQPRDGDKVVLYILEVGQ